MNSSDPLRQGLSLVIPVYNSEPTLPSLIDRLEKAVAQLHIACEFILVNDGSRDGSWDQIQKLSEQHPLVRGICLMRNYGQHAALLCGIRAARFDLIVTLDDDLQTPPEEIPKLLKKLEEGHDVVYGTPATRQHGLWRDLGSKLTKLALQTAMRVQDATHVSAYRLFRTRLRDSFATYHTTFVSIDVLLTYGSSRFSHVVVAHEPRAAGKSNYSMLKLVNHAVNTVTSFSELPLRVATTMGFAMTLFGFGILVFVLGRLMITGRSVPGFPFLASIIAIFSGAQLFAIGIVGEYIGRIHRRSMGQPAYAVRETTAK